jgi:hypothetical protein
LCGRPLSEPGRGSPYVESFLCYRHDEATLAAADVRGLLGPNREYVDRVVGLDHELRGAQLQAVRCTTGERFAIALDLTDGRVLEIRPGAMEPLLIAFPASLVETRDVQGFDVLDEARARATGGPFDKGAPKKNLETLWRAAAAKERIAGVSFARSQDGRWNWMVLHIDLETMRFVFDAIGWSSFTDDDSTDLGITTVVRT